MITIPVNLHWENNEYFDKVIKFAETTGQEHSLQKALDQLSSLAPRITLHPDYSPYSFLFDAGYINGGCIFHGQHDNGGDGGAPTYSVNLEKTYGWSIHT